MTTPWHVLVLLIGALALGPPGAAAQSPGATPGPDTTGADTTRAWHDGAWNDIVTREGLSVSYIFYARADNSNNGVVLRLRNHNDYPVRYRFTVIFRGPDGRASAQAHGRVAARSIKTGEHDGLFWVPFKDGRSIGEVGLRGLEVRRETAAVTGGPSRR